MKRYIKADITDLLEEPEYLQEEFACDPDTRPRVLDELSRSKYTIVRIHVAANPSTPADILARMANDEDETVKIYVGTNPNTPLDVIMDIYANGSKKVIDYVGDFLEDLAWDSEDKDILSALSHCISATVRMSVARNEDTPGEALIELSKDDSARVVLEAVCNPSMPVDYIREMAKSDDYILRYGAAYNKSTPIDVVEMLADDPNDDVKRTAMRSLERLYYQRDKA